MADPPRRTPAGTPTGGRFAPSDHSEAALTPLTDDEPADNPEPFHGSGGCQQVERPGRATHNDDMTTSEFNEQQQPRGGSGRFTTDDRISAAHGIHQAVVDELRVLHAERLAERAARSFPGATALVFETGADEETLPHLEISAVLDDRGQMEVNDDAFDRFADDTWDDASWIAETSGEDYASLGTATLDLRDRSWSFHRGRP